MKSLKRKNKIETAPLSTNLVIASENQDPDFNQNYEEIISVHSNRPNTGSSNSSEDSELEKAQRLQQSIKTLNDIKKLSKTMEQRFELRTGFLHSQTKKVKRESCFQHQKRSFLELCKRWGGKIKIVLTALIPWRRNILRLTGAFQVPYRCLLGAISGALQVLFQVPSWCLTGVLPGAFQVLFRCLPGAELSIH